jgi:hypothetical protein
MTGVCGGAAAALGEEDLATFTSPPSGFMILMALLPFFGRWKAFGGCDA